MKDVNGTLIHLNDRAKTYHKIMENVDKPLLLLFSIDHNGTLMTVEAYDRLKAHMSHEDLQTHQILYIDASSAALLGV